LALANIALLKRDLATQKHTLKRKLTMVLEINRSSRSETLQHNHTHCTANIGFTAEELEQFSWGTRGLFEQMPANGDGYECYGDHCYGWLTDKSQSRSG
jgi:hypothetical protein